MLLSQLNAERSTSKARAAQLTEAQEALSSMRHLMGDAKEAELAEAHKEVRANDEHRRTHRTHRSHRAHHRTAHTTAR